MEIKTLAQILAESDNDSASSLVAKKKPSQTQNTTDPASSRYQSHASAKPNKNNKASANSYTQKRKKNARQISKMANSLATAQSAASPSFSECSVNNNQTIPALTTSSPALHKTTARKKGQRKKGFHPASVYIPKDLAGNPIESVIEIATTSNASPTSDTTNTSKEPTIKSILAELKPASALREQSTDKNAAPLSAAPSTKTVADADSDDLSHIPSALKVYLLTPEQRHAKKEATKAESRLRWLAFYYLSRREYARGELKQKLLDKDQDPDKIEALLDEFAEKGYQSDWRTALMLIREGIRKGRGRQRIKQDFYKRKLDIPSNIDELIDMASTESDEFADFIDSDAPEQGVDWLKLAVEARVKKYGADLPESPKEKARQLRFLQYRGFKSDICFEALKYDEESLEERDI